MKKQHKAPGFSLVELSIVIVIIGLIVSSILVGQNLIRSAEIRALVSQYESFNNATATFRDKYSALPGDIDANGRYNFGLAEASVVENGLLQDATPAHADHNGEYTLFWNHLGTGGANLIKNSYAGGAITASLDTTLPQSEVGGYWGTFSTSSGDNYFIFGAAHNGTDATWMTEDIISPQDLFTVDRKIDDGKPGRGILRAQDGHATQPLTAPDAAGADACATAATADGDYDLTITEPTCSFSIKMRI